MKLYFHYPPVKSESDTVCGSGNLICARRSVSESVDTVLWFRSVLSAHQW